MFNQKLKYCYYHVILNLTFFLSFNTKDGVLDKKGNCIKIGAVKIQKLTREGIFFQEIKSTLLDVPPKIVISSITASVLSFENTKLSF